MRERKIYDSKREERECVHYNELNGEDKLLISFSFFNFSCRMKRSNRRKS